MIRIDANIPVVEPPQWAILERSLIDLMNEAVAPIMERYVRADGSVPVSYTHLTLPTKA